MINEIFRGVATALITPFLGGKIDFDALASLIERQISAGIDALVIAGTTGEGSTLTDEEHREAIAFAVNRAEKKVPIIAGTGSNDTAYALDLTRCACEAGADAVLVVTPYYNKPNQKGIYAHYKAVAEASPVPVILYNVPGRTGVNITAETCLQLANDFPNIIGIKEASGNIMQCMDILANKPQNFTVVSGEDALVMPLMSLGMQGVISVTANALPQQMSEMVNFCLKSNYKKAKVLHEELLPFSKVIFEEGNPVGIKAALEILDICQNNVRLPLVKSSKQLYSKIQTIINNIQSNNNQK